MKTCFSEGKLMKQFGNSSLSNKPPPPFSQPPNSEQFFHDPPLPNFKNKKLILGGGDYDY